MFISDGSEVDVKYIIEYYMVCNNFDCLEKVVVDVFKVGFEVIDVEEVYFDDGGIVFCFDIIVECFLKCEELDVDIDLLLKIVDKY